MKTAISIPDDIFEEAETVAQRLGMSRSGLYAKALSGFLEAHREENVTKALNQVYSDSAVSSELDIALVRMQSHSLPDEDW